MWDDLCFGPLASCDVVWDAVEAIGTTAAVLVSAVLFFLQSRSHRKDRMLALQPHLDVLASTNREGKKSLTYTLLNDGLGPAVVCKLAVSVDGEVVPFRELKTYEELEQGLGDGWQVKGWNAPPGTVVRAGMAPEIISIVQTDRTAITDEQAIERLANLKSRIGISVRYKDIFNREFETSYPAKPLAKVWEAMID